MSRPGGRRGRGAGTAFIAFAALVIAVWTGGCIRLRERVRFEERVTGTRADVRPEGPAAIRATRVAWSDGAIADVRVESARTCTTSHVESFERVSVHSRRIEVGQPFVRIALWVELIATGIGLVAGPLILVARPGDEANAVLIGGAVTGGSALLAAGFVTTAVLATRKGERLVLRDERVRDVARGPCEAGPVAGAALVAEVRGRTVALGKTGGDGVLSVDLAKRGPEVDALLAAFELGDRVTVRIEGGDAVGTLDARPLLALAEADAWSRTFAAATRAGYEAYLARFSSGAHAADARDALSALDEDTAWRVAVRADGKEAYERYLARYGDGPHAAAARAALAWLAARAKDDVPGWEDYLRDHGGEPHRDRARRRLDELTGDADHDGVPNRTDLCMDEAETANGHDDTDGCPDVALADLPVVADLADTAWTVAGELPTASVVVVEADADDSDWLWLVTAEGDVQRLHLSDMRVAAAGHLPASVRSLHSLPGLLVAIDRDGGAWTSADGGLMWTRAAIEDGSARAAVTGSVRCGDRVWLATDAGLFAVEPALAPRARSPGRMRGVGCDEAGAALGVRDDGVLVHVNATGAVTTSPGPEGLGAGFASAQLARWRGDLWLAAADGRVWRRAGEAWVAAGEGLPPGGPAPPGASAPPGPRLFALGDDLYLAAAGAVLFRRAGARWAPAEAGSEGMSVRALVQARDGRRYLLAVSGRAVLMSLATVRAREVLAGAVLFDTGSADPRPGLLTVIEDVVSAWREHPRRRLRIEGHTDAVGARAKNMELSRARADTVRRLLVERGVPAWAVATAGYGPVRPVASNATEDGRARNRRVEVLFLE